MAFAKGETDFLQQYKNIKPGIVCRKESLRATYVASKKLDDSISKKEALEANFRRY